MATLVRGVLVLYIGTLGSVTGFWVLMLWATLGSEWACNVFILYRVLYLCMRRRIYAEGVTLCCVVVCFVMLGGGLL